MKVLVVGGDGFIGRALTARLTEAGHDVHATSRRRDAAVPLDLANPDLAGVPAADAAVICAAVARLDDCEADPAGSRAINVEGPAALARHFAEIGTPCILLSSDKVFDGSRPHRARTDAPCPASDYGRQKAAAEAAVLAAHPGNAVLRLSKVVSADLALFRDWATALRAGQPIAPFRDMAFAPVPLPLVTEAINRLIEARHSGLWQLSGDEDRSYADAATIIAAVTDADPTLVQPTSSLAPPAARPPHTTLDMRREADALGLHAPPFAATIAGIA